MSNRKTFQELEFKDAFMFAEVMSDPETCRSVLERVLGIPVRKVVIRSEYAICISPDYHSVRLDVYADDQQGTVFDVEMQVTDKKNLPKRSRAYQAQMDVALLEPGMDYNCLPESVVIFICCFDPFDGERYRYTFQDQCAEDGRLLEDGTCKVFLNTKGKNPHEVPEELVRFLSYVENPKQVSEEETDPLVERLQRQIMELKSSRRMEARYMQFQEMLKDEHEAGHQKGCQETSDQYNRLIICMSEDGRVADLARLAKEPDFKKEMLAYYGIK